MHLVWFSEACSKLNAFSLVYFGPNQTKCIQFSLVFPCQDYNYVVFHGLGSCFCFNQITNFWITFLAYIKNK